MYFLCKHKKSAIHLDNQYSNLLLSAHLFVSNNKRSETHGQISTGCGLMSNEGPGSLEADREWNVAVGGVTKKEYK